MGRASETVSEVYMFSGLGFQGSGFRVLGFRVLGLGF